MGVNNFINVDLSSDNVIILGSAYVSSNIIPFDSKLPIKYTYNGAVLTISNINKLDSGTIYNLLVRVAISANDATLKATITIDAVANNISPLFKGISSSIPLSVNVNRILSGATLGLQGGRATANCPSTIGVFPVGGEYCKGFIDITSTTGASTIKFNFQTIATDSTLRSIL